MGKRILALSGEKRGVAIQPDGAIAIVPDGNTRLAMEGVDAPYDQAGRNVFSFLKYVNQALFFILSSKNLEKRGDVFFKELKQSFLLLKIAILQGKIWGDGIEIQLDIDEHLFHEGDYLEEKGALLKEIKTVKALNDAMMALHGSSSTREVTLRFGAEDDDISSYRRVIRTGSDGTHRFSGMIDAPEPFISVISETAFGKLDDEEGEIKNLVEATQALEIDYDVTAHTKDEAITFVQGIEVDRLQELGGAHISLACEDTSLSAVNEIRSSINHAAVCVISEGETPVKNSDVVIEIVNLNLDDIESFDAVLLGNQAGNAHAIIPACKPGEVRFIPTGPPSESGRSVTSTLEFLSVAQNNEGADSIKKTEFNPKFSEVIESAGILMCTLIDEFSDNGFQFIRRNEEGEKDGKIKKRDIPKEFTLNGRLSLKSLSGYMLHMGFVGEAKGLKPEQAEVMARYVMCTYSIDQIFDFEDYDERDRELIKNYLIDGTELPDGFAGKDSITKVKNMISRSRKDIGDAAMGIWDNYLNQLITKMASEREKTYDSVEDYLDDCSSTVGAGLIGITLAGTMDETEQGYSDLISDDIIIGINRYARLLNDLNTAQTEETGPNALKILGGDRARLIERIEQEWAVLEPKIEGMKDSPAKDAMKRLLYMGTEIYKSKDGYIQLDISDVKNIISNYE